MHRTLAAGIAAATLLAPLPALAQDTPSRTRVGIGPQVTPSFPGSDDVSFSPMFEFSRARGSEIFDFEAPDESIGMPILRSGPFEIGPAFNFQGARGKHEAGVELTKVDFTVELGGFANLWVVDNVRLRAEARYGVNGHEGLIGTLSGDYVARDGDQWLFSIGPRVTFAGNGYESAYFDVTPGDAITSGLPVYDADGGLHSAGAAAAYLQKIDRRWSVYGYVKYDRLLGDGKDSPIVTQLGSRDQFSGGIALFYTFGAARD
ncbi:MipA/OmpV family protein [Stakelama tenebrarum]|uniref:MipA/OmpV family protein n=1 Tax=Stakelama tenebrarum TaxID=2711215 RepID=A0A6G6Y7B0_9SPHN|nr:MipA/OmpV family protein [Sphingosinithalassobacter tenebrarum]QIG80598.1 MipA/OmpV family protein [Sphingosinithalassobacter tenebrarum]